MFRVAQGIGAAVLMTNSSAIVTDAAPKGELGKMLGISQTSWRVGSIAGLTLSGIILSITSWRGLFYVNIPIGIIGTIWSYYRLRDTSVKDSSKKIDWSGLCCFCVSLTTILLSLTYFS